MRLSFLIALSLTMPASGWAAEQTARPPGVATTVTGVPVDNGRTTSSFTGPIVNQPVIGNGFYGGPNAQVVPPGEVENTPINTNTNDGAGSTGAAAHAESVYGRCSADDKGVMTKPLVSWDCHAPDGTVISASECQTPAATSPCN